jgi:hypothetical protein
MKLILVLCTNGREQITRDRKQDDSSKQIFRKIKKLDKRGNRVSLWLKIGRVFNDIGFKDSYGQGFPSRWKYTDDRLTKINGTPELDKCIKKLFAPINFIGRFSDLDRLVAELNQFLVFDKWKVIRNQTEITFAKAEKLNFEDANKIKEDEILNREFREISLDKLGLDGMITNVLGFRFEEIKKCLSADAPLSVIFLSGSTLEGILLGIAIKYPKAFNQAKSSPKDKEGKVKQFKDWTLSNLIDVALEVGLIMEDVRKFSHSLRDFRN